MALKMDKVRFASGVGSPSTGEVAIGAHCPAAAAAHFKVRVERHSRFFNSYHFVLSSLGDAGICASTKIGVFIIRK